LASDLAQLVCGTPDREGNLGEVLLHLGVSIDAFCGQLAWLSGENDHRATLLGPYVGRSLLELCFTALIARLDPFRVLVLREMQMQTDQDIGSRRASSIQWHGDVMPKTPPPSDVWDSDKDFEKVSRALLADYCGRVYWEDALMRLVDRVDDTSGGEWMNELRRTEPRGIAARLRGEATTIFSALSKGVHHEFVVPPGGLYDSTTVFSLIGDALRVSCHLALMSHTIPHCPFCLPLTEGLRLYEGVQSRETS